MARANEYDAMLRGDDFTVDVNELSWAAGVLMRLREEMKDEDDWTALEIGVAACDALYRAAHRIGDRA